MQKNTKYLLFLAIGFLAAVILFLLAPGLPELLTTLGNSCSIKNSSMVRVHYVLGAVTSQGTIPISTNMKEVAMASGLFDPFSFYEPINATIGSQDVLPGVSEALIGMKKGDEKVFAVLPEKGYGNRDESKVREYPTEEIMQSLGIANLSLNMNVPTDLGSARIVFLNSTTAFLDFNLPLAGQTLIYRVKVVDVQC